MWPWKSNSPEVDPNIIEDAKLTTVFSFAFRVQSVVVFCFFGDLFKFNVQKIANDLLFYLLRSKF